MGMSKAVSPLVSYVLIIAIGFTVITVAVLISKPVVERAIESAVVNEGMLNMKLLSNTIREVASEGVGSLRTIQLQVGGGSYKVDNTTESLDYTALLSSGLLQKGTFTKEGDVLISVGATAKARQNSTHLILENEVLEVVQPKIGNQTNFAGINTSNAITTITLKDTNATIAPTDSRVIIGGVANTSWGLGYSKLVFEGRDLPKAESLFHVRSNFTGIEYEVIYTLLSSTDFLLVNVKNISSSNTSTFVLSYQLGNVASGSDRIRFGDLNETTFQS